VKKLRSSLVLVASMSALTACSGDDGPAGVNSGDALSEAEIQAVFFTLSEAFGSLAAAPAAAGPARATRAVNESVTGEAPCAAGGMISGAGSARGTLTDTPLAMDIRFQLRLTPSGCVVNTETATLTLESAPYIQLNMDFLLTETLIEVDGSYAGGIAFTSTDGRSGSCSFDVGFDVSVNLDDQSGGSSVTGSVCGVSVSGLQAFSVD